MFGRTDRPGVSGGGACPACLGEGPAWRVLGRGRRGVFGGGSGPACMGEGPARRVWGRDRPCSHWLLVNMMCSGSDVLRCTTFGFGGHR